MPNNYCQTFKQKIEELEIKAQNIEALLSEYKKTAKEEIADNIKENLIEIEKFIEEFKQEFKNKATQLIKEFIQRRDNIGGNVKIIFDEKDGRFIIEGNLIFSFRTHLDDFPNLIKGIRGNLKASDVQAFNLPNLKEVEGNFIAFSAQTINLPNLKKNGGDFYAENAQTINLPNLEKIGGYFYAENAQTINLPNLEKIGGYFNAKNAQTINLPNIKEIREDIIFNENNPNLNSLIEVAREWRKKGILKDNIKISDKEGNLVQEF
jgi:hypothetical protein